MRTCSPLGTGKREFKTEEILSESTAKIEIFVLKKYLSKNIPTTKSSNRADSSRKKHNHYSLCCVQL